MSVCVHRPEEVGFFTPCKPCLCGREVLAELSVVEDEEAEPLVQEVPC